MLNKVLSVFFISCLFFSCKTDDVEGSFGDGNGPMVVLSSNAINITENGGVATITATLATSTSIDVSVGLTFSGSASSADYAESGSTIVIQAGALSSGITITAAQDDIEEGNETIVLTISALVGGNTDGTQEITLTIEDDDVPLVAQLILNEILYDPSNSGLDGDANGDGSYAQSEDEFLEFVNLSASPLNMCGYKIFDEESLASDTPNHSIPDGTIVPAGGVLLIFGGGTPTGVFGNAIVQISTTGDLNLNNAGDVMYLLDSAGETLIAFDIEPLSGNPNESYTRDPDLSGNFVQHGSVVDGVLFSPGTRTDGSPL